MVFKVLALGVVAFCVMQAVESRYESDNHGKYNYNSENGYWDNFNLGALKNWSNMFRLHPRSDQILKVFMYSSVICLILQTISIFSAILVAIFRLLNTVSRVTLLVSALYLATLFIATTLKLNPVRDLLLNW